MLLQRSLEQLNVFTHDHLTIGATLVGAATHLIAQEVRATQADKSRMSDKPDVDKYESDSGDALFLIDVGLFQKVPKVKNRLGPALAHMGPSVFFDHTSNVEASRAAELEAIHKEAGRRLVTLSISRGGKKRLQIMSDQAFRQERGPTELASFESAPFIWDHVAWRGKAMGHGALMLPDSRTLARIYAHRMEGEQQKAGELFVRGTEPSDFYGVKNGIRGLMLASPDEMAIREAFSEDNVATIIAVSALNDRMVRTKDAHEWLQHVTGRTIPFHIDPLRPEGDHAGITDTPEFQVRQIEQYLSSGIEATYELESAA